MQGNKEGLLDMDRVFDFVVGGSLMVETVGHGLLFREVELRRYVRGNGMVMKKFEG